MTRFLKNLSEVSGDYGAVVLDQWGVLHDGSKPYDGARAAVAALNASGTPVAVLSNSGKRASENAARIVDVGFSNEHFDIVMTSGEALWMDIQDKQIAETQFFAVERQPGDASRWATGLPVTFTTKLQNAEAILLMGLPDESSLSEWRPILNDAKARNLKIYCSNPDRKSPRHGGGLVISPGALAYEYQDMGGAVAYYGKPHKPIFDSLSRALGVERFLMVGDSLEHDIAGANKAGWDSVLIRNGIYAKEFSEGDASGTLKTLCATEGVAQPTFCMGELA